VALASLVAHLRARGFTLFDIQQCTSHTASLGAIDIPRQAYLRRLAEALRQDVSFGDRLDLDGKVAQ
jgi:leucyl/phenylalanyl-tRNA--protein transferase